MIIMSFIENEPLSICHFKHYFDDICDEIIDRGKSRKDYTFSAYIFIYEGKMPLEGLLFSYIPLLAHINAITCLCIKMPL